MKVLNEKKKVNEEFLSATKNNGNLNNDNSQLALLLPQLKAQANHSTLETSAKQ